MNIVSRIQHVPARASHPRYSGSTPSLAAADNAMGAWLCGLLARAYHNVVVVALAAKLARTTWATLRRVTTFERQPNPAAG